MGSSVPAACGRRATITQDRAYNAFPSACALGDGRVLVVYRKATDHFSTDGVIVGRHLDGACPGPELTIASSPGFDCRDPGVIMLRDGTIVASFVVTTNGATPVRQVMCTTRSPDGGTTWSTATRVPTTMDFYDDEIRGPMGGFCSGAPVELPNGTLLLPYYGASRCQSPTFSWSRCARSTDRAASWSDYTTIAGHDEAVDHLEPVIALVRVGSGATRLLCAMRRDTGTTGIRIAWSDDLGASWGPSTQAFDGFTGKPAIRQLSDGGIVCMQRGPGGYHAGFRHSADFGASWSHLHDVDTSGMHVYGEWVPRLGMKIALVYAIETSPTTANVYLQDFR